MMAPRRSSHQEAGPTAVAAAAGGGVGGGGNVVSSVPRPSPPRRQPPHSPDELQFAKRTLQKLVQDSHFFPVHDKNNRVQTIRESELEIGSVIGRGGFCEVRCARVNRGGGGGIGLQGGGGWEKARNNVGGADGDDDEAPRYAMKYLSPSKTTSSRVFQRGIADLAMEACFLSLLRHDNIIGLHYVSEGSLEENYNCAPGSSRDGSSHRHRGDRHHNHNHDTGRQRQDEIVMDSYGNLQLRRPTSDRRRGRGDDHHDDSSHFFGYFLLLDPLHETLTDRIEKTCVPRALRDDYGIAAPQSNAKVTKMLDRIRQKNQGGRGHNRQGQLDDPNDPKVELAQRLNVVKDVASALKYLHDECHIIFRDIKPDNIGFYRRYRSHCTCGHNDNRVNGRKSSANSDNPDGECSCYEEVTKLFDFGLAKELKPKYRKSHPAYPDQPTYKLTGCTGSRRYMAPEVCFSDPYNVKADVYSFGMLLYQVASLVTPFDGFSMGKHEREVLRGGYRPDVRMPPPQAAAASNPMSAPFALKGKSRDRRQDREADAAGSSTSDPERRNERIASKTKRHWPKELPRLMEECWDYDMRYRPEMKSVERRLERCVRDLVPYSRGDGNNNARDDNSSRGGGNNNVHNAATAGGGNNWPPLRFPHAVSKDAETQDTQPMSSHHTFSPSMSGRDGRSPHNNQKQPTSDRRGGQRHHHHHHHLHPATVPPSSSGAHRHHRDGGREHRGAQVAAAHGGGGGNRRDEDGDEEMFYGEQQQQQQLQTYRQQREQHRPRRPRGGSDDDPMQWH